MSHPTILQLKNDLRSKTKQLKYIYFESSATEQEEADEGSTGGMINGQMLQTTLDSFDTVRKDMVGLMRRFVTTAVFGVAVPPLLVLAPLLIWIQGCASKRVHRNNHRKFKHGEASETAFTFRIVSAVLVQQPVKCIQATVHLLVWLVTGFVIIDLQFETGNHPTRILANWTEPFILRQVQYFFLWC